jgi:hypothetical protein
MFIKTENPMTIKVYKIGEQEEAKSGLGAKKAKEALLPFLLLFALFASLPLQRSNGL